MKKRKGDQNVEVPEKAKKGLFEMDYLMQNQGLDHLSEKIFQLLNVQTIARCRLVSKLWLQSLDKIWIIKQLETFQRKLIEIYDSDEHESQKKQLVEYQPEWIQIFQALAKQNDVKIVHFIKQYYLDIEASRMGLTPLHYACKYGQVELVNLLNSKIDFHKSDNSKRTSLHHACHSGNAEIVKVLIQNNLNVNAQDEDGKTPLHFACEIGSTEVVKMLFSKSNVQSNVNDKDLMTPLLLASKCGNFEVIKLFITSKSIDFNETDSNGLTPLHHACQNGYTEIVQLLLKHSKELKIDVNATDFDKEMTPVHFACKYGHTETVKILLNSAEEKGIDLKAWDENGKTPLQVASKETVQVLLDYANTQKDMNLMQWIPVWPWN